VEDGGTVGYGGFGAFGFYVMDLSDIKHPKPYGHTQYEFNAFGMIPFPHVLSPYCDAAHPRLQNIVVAVHEALEADCREVYHTPYVLDVKNLRDPKIIGFFPRPAALPMRPIPIFASPADAFGSHNTQCWLARRLQSRDHCHRLVQLPASGFSTSRTPQPRRKSRGSYHLTTETSTSTRPGGEAQRKRVRGI